MKMLEVLTVAVALLTPSLLHAQGRVDIEAIEGLHATDVNVWVDLEGPMLKLASRALASEDEELAELVSSLESLRVRVIEDNTRLASQLRESMPEAMQELEANGWKAIVRVHEDDESVYVYSKTDGEDIAGLFVVVLEPDEVVFVNIDGPIQPKDLDRIWQMPAMDAADLDEHLEVIEKPEKKKRRQRH